MSETGRNWKKLKFTLPNATYQKIPSVTAPKYSKGLACSSLHYAFCTTLNELAVLPFDIIEGSKEVDKAGRAGGYGATTYEVDEVRKLKAGKRSEFTDFAFDAFNPSLIYSSHFDSVVRGWKIPSDGLSKDTSSSSFTVKDVGVPVSLTTSEAISDVLIVNSEGSLGLVTPSSETLVKTWAVDFKEKLMTSQFSHDSSVLRASSDKKNIYTVDIRQSKLASKTITSYVAERIYSLNSNDLFFCLGLDSLGRLQCQVWDPRKGDKSVWKSKLPGYQNYTLASHERDPQLLYLGSRYATTYDLYDISGCVNGKDMNLLLKESLARPAYGFASHPKKTLKKREIAVCAALLEGSIIPVQSNLNTQTYKKCVDPKPALTSKEWLGGRNATRVLNFEFCETQKDLSKKTKARSKVQNVNVHELPEQGGNFFTHLNVDRSGVSGQYNIRMNSKYAVTMAESMSDVGRLAVLRLDLIKDDVSRCEEVECLCGHTTKLSTFDISSHRTNLIATGGGDQTVNLWQIPDKRGKQKITEPVGSLKTSLGRVRFVRFHPKVTGLLLVASYDRAFGESESALSLHDVSDPTNPREVWKVDIEDGLKISDVDFSNTGTKVLVSMKGGKVRVVNARSGATEFECKAREAKRDVYARWLSESKFVTGGIRANAKWGFSVWDLSDDQKEQMSHDLNDTAPLLFHVDPDFQLIYCAGIGLRRIRTFEVFGSEIFVHGQSHMCWENLYGLGWVRKTNLDVRKAELNKVFRLGAKNVVPVSFQLMRKRKEYFQDDVYPKVYPNTSSLTAEQFLNGDDIPENRVSLQPEDMVALSLAPDEQETKGAANTRRRKSQIQMNKMTSLTGSVMATVDAEQKLLDSVNVMSKASNWAPDIGQWTIEAEDGGVEDDEWSD